MSRRSRGDGTTSRVFCADGEERHPVRATASAATVRSYACSLNLRTSCGPHRVKTTPKEPAR